MTDASQAMTLFAPDIPQLLSVVQGPLSSACSVPTGGLHWQSTSGMVTNVIHTVSPYEIIPAPAGAAVIDSAIGSSASSSFKNIPATASSSETAFSTALSTIPTQTSGSQSSTEEPTHTILSGVDSYPALFTGLTAGTIAGILVAALTLCMLAVATVWYRRRRHNRMPPVEMIRTFDFGA